MNNNETKESKALSKTMFFVMETIQGYGLKVEEYEDNKIIHSGKFPGLTGNSAEMEEVVRLLWENGVYAVHVKDVLEDLGYAV